MNNSRKYAPGFIILLLLLIGGSLALKYAIEPKAAPPVVGELPELTPEPPPAPPPQPDNPAPVIHGEPEPEPPSLPVEAPPEPETTEAPAEEPAPANTEAAQPRVTLTGRVVDANGDPVAGVHVLILLVRPGEDDMRTGPNPTDEDGRFTASQETDHDVIVHVLVLTPAGAQYVAPETHGMSPGDSVHDVVVRLPVLTTIRGRVVDFEGRPLKDADVTFSLPRERGVSIALVRGGQTTTDEEGEYRIELFDVGQFDASASVSDSQYRMGFITVSTSAAAETWAPDIVLARRMQLRFRLVDNLGNSVVTPRGVHVFTLYKIPEGGVGTGEWYTSDDGWVTYTVQNNESMALTVKVKGYEDYGPIEIKYEANTMLDLGIIQLTRKED